MDAVMLALLGATVILPALVFRFATFDGDVVAVLYREPKKDIIGVLVWLLVLAFFLLKGRALDLRDLTRRISDPTVISLSLLLSYFGLTRLWVMIPENWTYEMSQYALLFVLLLVGLVWSSTDPAVPVVIRNGLITSIAVVTGIGMIQWAFPSGVPAAINPFNEVAHPSLMGYKNPAALSVLGQFFILAGVAFSSELRSKPVKVLIMFLLAVELIYIVSLQSRAALVALACGSVVLLGLQAIKTRRLHRRTIITVVAGVTIAATALLVIPNASSRNRSALDILIDPGSYLETDRGVYLLNTLKMVSHHPFGVGIGDWQTRYPVYRDTDPDFAFDDDFQVRRAHSDHVQILGEAGWPGLILWLGFLGLLVWRCGRSAIQTGDSTAACITAQLVAISVAMCSDFFTEIPYNKYQFFLVVLLAINCTRPTRSIGSSRPKRFLESLAVISPLIAIATITCIVATIQTERKLVGSATSTALFLHAIHSDPGASSSSHLLEEATAIGRGWVTDSGHWKSLYRDHLALAKSAARIDRDRMARVQALESLHLYPFNPQSLRLMATLSRDPVEASLWLAASHHVEEDSGNGFTIQHPLGDRYTDMAH